MNVNTREKFGNDLREARSRAGLTQFDCARHCSVSVNSYQYWERGISEPKEDRKNLICTFLGLNKEDYQ